MEFGVFMTIVATLGILFVAFPAVLMKGISRLRRERAENAGAGGALRMSELERMIAGAVAHATAPMLARIETLEAIVTERDEPVARLAAPSRDRLALPAPDDEEEMAAPRARVRA
ncbi:MAG TPA: hypothetical protein VK610_08220 [Rhodothermales bacterium]|nr:hypothetical protein [Rhodothermales bacterium]